MGYEKTPFKVTSELPALHLLIFAPVEFHQVDEGSMVSATQHTLFRSIVELLSSLCIWTSKRLSLVRYPNLFWYHSFIILGNWCTGR